MKLSEIFLAATALLPVAVTAKSVVAHVIVSKLNQLPKTHFNNQQVGNTASYTTDTWKNDISLAQAAGIDGFVLNIAPPLNGVTSTQVSNAFTAVKNSQGGFKLLFSFDYLGGGQPWHASDVVNLLQTYGPNDAHMKVQGKYLLPFGIIPS